MTVNANIARLDRTAALLGLAVRDRGGNAREFDLDETRVIRYRPQGLGTLRVVSVICGEEDAVVVCPPSRVEGLMEVALRRA